MKIINQDVIYYEDNSLKISRQNYLKKENDMLPHNHDFLTISLLLSGSLIEHTSEETKIVKSGSILIKPAALMHSDMFTENCTILSLNLYDWNYHNFDCKNWEIIEQNMLLKCFLKIIKDRDKKQPLNELKSSLELITTKSSIKKNIPKKIKEVRKIIDNHFLEPIRITQLAREVNMHPVHLGRTFKEYYKIDIKSYQQQLRIHYTVSEMIVQNANLSNIAYSTGYSDQSHFSRAFKKATDFSPKKVLSLLNV